MPARGPRAPDQAGCPLLSLLTVRCRVKPESRHEWLPTERLWHIQNYCHTGYHTDCPDFAAYQEHQAIGKGKILVVDDEPVWLETLASFFGSRGYQLVTAASAETALTLLAEEQPALALIDIRLPGMNGLELLRRIKQEYPQVKTFVVTAYDEEHKHAAETLGVDGFFAKPVGLESLKQQVVQALAAAPVSQSPKNHRAEPAGSPAARLLFVYEPPTNGDDPLRTFLQRHLSNPADCGGQYDVAFAGTLADTLNQLTAFRPDLVLINADLVEQMPAGQLAARVIESPYRPKEVIVYGLNLDAGDKQALQELGAQYVDLRRSAARLFTAIRQTALQHGLQTAQ